MRGPSGEPQPSIVDYILVSSGLQRYRSRVLVDTLTGRETHFPLHISIPF